MGQMNSSLGPEDNPGMEYIQKHSTEGKSSLKVQEPLDENKKNDLKTMHCVKSRIDMLIEDCLNIKETSSIMDDCKEPIISTKPGEKNIDSNCKTDTDISGKTKKDLHRMESVQLSKEENSTEKLDIYNQCFDTSTEKNCSNSIVGDANLSLKTTEQSSGNAIEDSLPQKCLPSHDHNATNNDKHRKENLHITKQKNLTTFQKFIDEVFDNSLQSMKNEEVKTASNFLKLCSDSLKSDKEENTSVCVKESAKDTCDVPRQEMEIPYSKKITLKDHIERFLEASFREEMGDKSIDSSATPKNLNAHMLVNKMITNGLLVNSIASNPVRGLQANIQGQEESIHDKNKKGSPKSNCVMLEIVKEKGANTDHENKREKVTASCMNEERQESKAINGSSRDEPNSSNFEVGFQGGQISNYKETSKLMEPRSGVYEGFDRRNPFDPRFADPKFKDNRIDIVPHEVNAHLNREHHYDRRNISKADSITGHMPTASQGLYQQRAPYQAGPTSPYTRNSPSSHYQNEHYNLVGKMSILPGHHGDCQCQACLSHSPQLLPKDHYVESQTHRLSPNYPQNLGPSHQSGVSAVGGNNFYHGDSSVMAMPGSIHSSSLPFGQPTYQKTSIKLVSHRSAMTAPIERSYGKPVLSADHIGSHNGQSRHPCNYSDFYSQDPKVCSRKTEQYPLSPVLPEKYTETNQEEWVYKNKGIDRRANSLRHGNMPHKEDLSSCHPKVVRHLPDHGLAKTMKQSESSAGGDLAPLDLSLRKSNQEYGFEGLSNFNGSPESFHSTLAKLNPTLTFIKHLENSVDKYCQELASPPSPMLIPRDGKSKFNNRSVSPNDRQSPKGEYSPLPSPHDVSSHGVYSPMLQGRSLPSPHYSGGITMGQPLVDKSQISQQNVNDVFGLNNVQNPTNVSIQAHSGIMPQMLTQSTFVDTATKKNMNSVSKHEPIQNIIGNHDSNDILYLYCKVCSSTYGSLYGFRKHFRNQHGFEPRPEHTIVHTISGTKSALQVPASLSGTESVPQGKKQMIASMLSSQIDDRPEDSSTNSDVHTSDDLKTSQVPQQTGLAMVAKIPNRLEASCSRQKVVDQIEKTKVRRETKFLECPECGKMFQLNDFGSYKRHCRQHGHIKPFECTDCHLSFTDQKGLKEHFKLHMKESQLLVCEENKSNDSSSFEMCKYSCNNCYETYTSVAQLQSHTLSVHENKSQNSVLSEMEKEKSNMKRDKSLAQTVGVVNEQSVPVITQTIRMAQSIVKQAAESMTVQVCPDSSWDKADDKNDQKMRNISNISLETDSGYSSSISSNLSQLVSDDNSNKKGLEKEPGCNEGKMDFNRSDSNDDKYEQFYKHKKFFHHRKRENSLLTNSRDGPPDKRAKRLDVLLSSSPTAPVSSSTLNNSNDSCDSQGVDSKIYGVNKSDQSDVHDKVEKTIPESGEMVTDVKPEARHNLPFVWDRGTRSRKAK